MPARRATERPLLARRVAAAAPPAAVGLAAVLLARDFPPIPGQAYGPALFPTLLGAALILCAIGVVLQPPQSSAPAVPLPAGAPALLHARARALAYALAPIAVLLGFEPLGWPLTALLVGGGLLLAAGLRPLAALAIATGVAAATWVLFAMLLRVPLPRGPLDFLPY
jgi:putative tricarboxylic transport membrane protein